MSSELIVDPEFAALIPPLTVEEHRALADALVHEGCRDPLVTWTNGKGTILLDGHNRFEICQEQKISFQTIAAPAVVHTRDDAKAWIIRNQFARRNLKPFQLAELALKLEPLLAAQAKERQQEARHRKGQGMVKENLPSPNDRRAERQTRDEVAKLAGISGRTLDKAKIVAAHAPEAVKQKVRSGELSIDRAARMVRPPRAAQVEKKAALVLQPTTKASGERDYSVDAWKRLSIEERRDIIAAGFEGRAKMNDQPSDAIEWARWSLNTVTGCLHDCPYCYARDIANRLYPQGFAPTFFPSRLSAPGNQKLPAEAKMDTAYRNVFANSMSDLFGQWVPEEWIAATIEMARRNTQWNFLTLTKFPQRAAEFEFPENWWMGTTVDCQARVANAEKAFTKIRCRTKWLSVEPLLQPLKFERLDLFQWIVIGGASASTKTPEWVPPLDWLIALHTAARTAGLRVYYKTNSGFIGDLRLREFPWGKPQAKMLPKTFHYLKGLS